ncbi:hypothetical protein KI688_001180 [Linnemannia hyalina]|uniref:Sel1 repeat family protein n=1 Tax=Linnemannia hyalina TaxID=64524 RepID=A0A9P7Y5I1_9FUNG|nr:hypothetical protein KI688_001180 [Linnemannia hyalina]
MSLEFTQTIINAGLGDKDAGTLYEESKGAPKLPWIGAIKRFNKEIQRVSAEWVISALWNVATELDIGHLYCYSLGTLQDYSLAMTWYFKADRRGSVVARYDVCQMFEIGQGNSQALEWYLRASNQGFAKA